MFSSNVFGSFVAEIVKSLCILSALQTGVEAPIFTYIVMVPPAFGASVPIFHVSLFPLTIGCPISGLERDEFATYVTCVGSVSVTTTPFAVPAPWFLYVSVYFTVCPGIYEPEIASTFLVVSTSGLSHDVVKVAVELLFVVFISPSFASGAIVASFLNGAQYGAIFNFTENVISL